MQDAKTVAHLKTALYSIEWIHRLAGETSLGSHPLLEEIMAAANRMLAHKTKKTDPITLSQLECLVRDKACTSASLMDIRSVAAALLAFAAFLRFDELVSLHISDIYFKDNYMDIFIESSKTDQYRDGAWVPVARSGKPTCPVVMLLRYFNMTGFDKSDDGSFLFRGLSKSAKGYKVRAAKNSLSYSRMRELLLEAFAPYVEDTSRIGTHSLRAGGATAAARAGVPDRLFKRHGRWRSENAKDGYVEDSLEERLRVSRSLGI